MTRRERLIAKLEKRQEWAAGRREKSARAYSARDPYRGDIAFWTQPGHIPERARVIRKIDQSFEHAKMADHHDSKAAGLEAQLDRSIFSDDENAIAELEARIAEHEAKRARMVKVNALYRKGDAAGLEALGLNLEILRAKLETAGAYWGKAPHLPYEMSNLGGRIKADRERIKAIRIRTERTAAAQASANGITIEGQDYISVTFAEKPSRATLEALKGAGFVWRQGSWHGYRAKLPADVKEG
jgi:hypothetical protein